MTSQLDRFYALFGKGAEIGSAGAVQAMKSKADLANLLAGKDAELANQLKVAQTHHNFQQQDYQQAKDDVNSASGVGKHITARIGDATYADAEQNPMAHLMGQAGTQAKNLTGQWTKNILPAYAKVAQGAQMLDSLQKGTTSADELSAAYKAMIAHNGGQVPQRLIQAFSEHGGFEPWLQGVLNKGTANPVSTMSPAQRKALGDLIVDDVQKQGKLAQAQEQDFRNNMGASAPALAATGGLAGMQFTNPYGSAGDEAVKRYNDWTSGASKQGPPAPGQNMGIGQQIGAGIRKAPASLAHFLGGLTSGLANGNGGQSAPAPVTQPAAPQSGQGSLSPEEQAELQQLRAKYKPNPGAQ